MPFANRNAKSVGKGNGPFAEQQLPECFCMQNGDPVLIAAALAVEGGEEGVALVSNSEAMRITLDQIHRMPFAAPCALLASAAQYDELLTNYPRIAERYRVERIVVPVLTGSKGGPRTTTAILFQLGNEQYTVCYNDPTVECELGESDSHLTKATIIIRKDTVPTGVFEGLTKHCHDFALAALGKDNFCSDHQIRTHPQRSVSWAGEEVQEVQATAYLRNGSKAAGFRRSGTN